MKKLILLLLLLTLLTGCRRCRKLKIGDVVRLKIGGIPLVVETADRGIGHRHTVSYYTTHAIGNIRVRCCNLKKDAE